MSAVQLITAILEAGPQLEALGLQIRLTNGVAQIFTSKIRNERLASFIAERAPVGMAGVGGLQHLEAAPSPRSSHPAGSSTKTGPKPLRSPWGPLLSSPHKSAEFRHNFWKPPLQAPQPCHGRSERPVKRAV
jgi:hypothetical protein